MAGIPQGFNASRDAHEELPQGSHEVVTLRRDPADQETISPSFNAMEVSARPTGWNRALDNVVTQNNTFIDWYARPGTIQTLAPAHLVVMIAGR
jgi:hypothetical protein